MSRVYLYHNVFHSLPLYRQDQLAEGSLKVSKTVKDI